MTTKSTAQHTPGPWLTSYTPSDASQTIYADQGRRYVTHVPAPLGPNGSQQEQFANARLIAAAPEMLSLLRHFVEWVKVDFPECPNAVADARALLAKIEGKG